ncbi:hypothetical protein EVC07_173 [Rhizobium phage RHph_N42]|nr:hypothetical protein EVC07_173 [Rhizobium phage RHph_N42]QIG74808.1 hypothetical protein EVC12_173 [Rhizobium phage RHph_I42]QXV73860.1 hypothetical protein [Rhizobium phage RHph_N46]
MLAITAAIIKAGYVFRTGYVSAGTGFKGEAAYYYAQIASSQHIFNALSRGSDGVSPVYGVDFVNGTGATIEAALTMAVERWNDTATGGAARIELPKIIVPTIETMLAAVEKADVYYRLTRTERHTAIIGRSFDNVQSFQGVYGHDYFLVNGDTPAEALYLVIRAWNDFHPDHKIEL